MRSLSRFLSTLAGLLALSACVTINIYFPAAAAEKAADRIIENVWGTQPAKPEDVQPEADPPKPQSLRATERPVLLGLLEWLVPSAQAGEADINVDTPGVRAIQQSMRARHRQLQPFYASGAVGLTRDALITVRDQSQVALRERNQLKGLVADDNRDRNALYREIAQANGHPEWEQDIRATFAVRWIENAARGWWYQDAGGRWTQK